MHFFRQGKITAIVCIVSILFVTSGASAEDQDRVTTPSSNVFISVSGFSLISLLLLHAAISLILISKVMASPW